MNATDVPDAWVPVPLRWRHVIVGDVFVGREQRLWHVVETGQVVTATSGTSVGRVEVDPDEVVSVLVPVVEADAVGYCREQLGARLVARRTAPAP